MYAVALEEHLLLEALRGLYNGSTPLPSAITMASRNDIIDLACTWLSSYEKQLFTRYATEISSLSHRCMVDFPPPPVLARITDHAVQRRTEPMHIYPKAQGHFGLQCARPYPCCASPRIPEDSLKARPSASAHYRKGGILGLCRETTGHPATCRLLNTAIIASNPVPHLDFVGRKLGQLHRAACGSAQRLLP